jgi:hypothetical protein
VLHTQGLCKHCGQGAGLVRAVGEVDLEVAVGTREGQLTRMDHDC